MSLLRRRPRLPLKHQSRGAAIGKHQLPELEREQGHTGKGHREGERPYANRIGEDSHEHGHDDGGPGEDASWARGSGLKMELEIAVLNVDTNARKQW